MKPPFDYPAIRKELQGLAKPARKAMGAKDKRTRKSNGDTLKRRIKALGLDNALRDYQEAASSFEAERQAWDSQHTRKAWEAQGKSQSDFAAWRSNSYTKWLQKHPRPTPIPLNAAIALCLREARIAINDPALGAWFDPLPHDPEKVARIVLHALEQLPPPREGRPATVVNPWKIHDAMHRRGTGSDLDRAALESAIAPAEWERGRGSAAERAASRLRKTGAYVRTHLGAVAITGLDKLAPPKDVQKEG